MAEPTDSQVLEQLRLIREEIASMKASRTLGVIEAAALLRIHKDTLYTKATAGVIPGVKIGRAWVFVEEDLLTYLREQSTRKVETPCLYTSKRAVKTGGPKSPTTDGKYGALLAQMLAERRKKKS